MRRISVKQYALALKQVAQGKDQKEMQAICENFLRLLSNHRQLSKKKLILQSLENLIMAENGQVSVTAQVAGEISSSLKRHLAAAWSEKFGQKVDLRIERNSALLGGVKLNWADQQIDASLSAKLVKLQQGLS